jgi:hypothetical protein
MGYKIRPAFFTVRKVLTNAQVKTLPTIPVDLITALGTGVTIIPVSIFLAFKSLGAYANFDLGFSSRLRYAVPSLSDMQLNGGLDVVLGSPADLAFQSSISGPSFPNFTDPLAINRAVQLSFANGASGNLTGGNVGNTLTVTLLYFGASA